MNKRIKGLFLKSTKIKQNSIIVDFITLNHGKASFVFKASKNKNISSLFQPFHFIDFSCKFNPDKKLNLANSPELLFPIMDIIRDVRKTGYALLLTETLQKTIHQYDANEALYKELQKMIVSFEYQDFNPAFGVFFIKELQKLIGIQPINNYSNKCPYFNLSESRFSSVKDGFVEENFPHKIFSQLLGMKIDDVFNVKITTNHRRAIMDLLIYYLQYHGHISHVKINSIKILQSLYD